MHGVLQGLAWALLALVLVGVVVTVIIVSRNRPAQPPRTRGEAAQVRGTFTRARSYQGYLLWTIRQGARGGRRRR